jgi:lipopolysaccharide/colanic/teichoic acid biosynthesis glycosyltransferase
VSAAPQEDVRSVTQPLGAEMLAAAAPLSAETGARPLTSELLRAAAKRAMDVVGAALALVLLAPLFGVIALVILLDSPGPLFYRAERVGFRGRPLRMLKFRKMHRDAAGGPLTVANDERLTRVGRWLARTKLDELPQLWHVLRGDMSLVGPRPESPAFVQRFDADYDLILRVRPGMTGFTQLAFARECRILDPLDPGGHYVRVLLPQKVRLDRLYAGRPSLRRDAEIMLATIGTLALRLSIAVNRNTGALTIRRRLARAGGTSRRAGGVL